MASPSARQMLGSLPKEELYETLREQEKTYLADPSLWTPETAYKAIIESGVSVQDALDAGVQQSTIDMIFTAPQGTPAYGGTQPTATMAQDVQAYYDKVMADNTIDAAERLDMQKIATDRGLSYGDMVAAGVDPNILYATSVTETETKPQTKTQPATSLVCPDGFTLSPDGKSCVPVNLPKVCPAGQKPDPVTGECVDIFTATDTDTGTGAASATGVEVYQPLDDNTGVYAAGEDSLDTTFRESGPRTEVTQDVMGEEQLTGFDYTPAASLLSATGSGFSWTPPTVTSRPRSLMGSAQRDRYTQGRAAQDLRQLTGGKQADFDRYKGLLNNRGSYGGGLSRSQLFALTRQQDSLDRRKAQESAPGGDIMAYIAANPDIKSSYEAQKGGLGGQTLADFATNHYNTLGKKEMDAGTRARFNLKGTGGTSPSYTTFTSDKATFGGEGMDAPNEGSWYGGPALIAEDIGRPGGAIIFAKGGPVKKPEGFANGGSAAADLKLLDPVPAWLKTDPLFITETVEEEVNPDMVKRDIPPMEWDGVERTTDQESTESKNLLENIISGAGKIPDSVGNYFVRPDETGGPSFVTPRQVGSDLVSMGGAIVDAVKEDDSFLKHRSIAEIAPITGEIISGADAVKFSNLANESRAAGDTKAADLYEQIVTLSAAGTAPLVGMGARAGRRAAINAAEEAIKKGALGDAAKMLDEVDAVNAPRVSAETGVPFIPFTEEYAAQITRTLPEPTNNNGYPGADVANLRGVKGDPIAEAWNRQIANDPMGMLELYKKHPETDGGKVHDTDVFRELNPNYLADRTIATSVHEPSGALNNMFYEMKLAETQGQPGRWLFTGGGPASGKSSGPAGQLRKGADLVYDGSLATYDTVAPRIDAALASGKQVEIAFVLRDPEKAIVQAVNRAMKQKKEFGTGRTIPINYYTGMHVDARQTLKRLDERYADNDAFKITVTSNQGGLNDARIGTLDEVVDLDYDTTVRKVTSVLDKMKKEGVIDEDIYQGFIRNTDLEKPTTPTSVLDTGGTPKRRGDGQAADQNDSQLGQERVQVSVEPLEVGVDETLSGGQGIRNYTPENLQSLDDIVATAPRGARKDPTKLSAGDATKNKLINALVEAGTKIGVRLNLTSQIPNAPRGMGMLQTLHKNNYNGKALSYVPYATVENVTFNVSQTGRRNIAAKKLDLKVPEAESKFPAMSVDGNYVPDRNLLKEGGEFVEIGFRPDKHHLFIDMNTGQAVKGADLATVVGDRVYAKGVQYYKKAEAPEPLPASDGTQLPSNVRYQQMKRGGQVERVYNDRKYV